MEDIFVDGFSWSSESTMAEIIIIKIKWRRRGGKIVGVGVEVGLVREVQKNRVFLCLQVNNPAFVPQNVNIYLVKTV
jgi:hypothetical protein